MNDHNSSDGFNLGRVFFGIILVLIGLYFLAKNFGWISFEINIWQLWPLIIILIGLSMMSIRSWVGGLIAGLVILGVFLVIFYGFTGPQKPTMEDVSFKVSDEAQLAEVNLQTGAGNLTVSGGSAKLLTGSFESNFLNLEQSSSVKNNLQTVNLSTTGAFTGWAGKVNNLDLQLGSQLPYQLDFDTGALDMEMDLKEIKVKGLKLNTGASDLDITFGNLAKDVNGEINAGASSIDINLPRDIGAQIILDSAISSKSLPEFENIDERTYQSKDYQSKDKTITVDLDLGASSLNVNWY